MPIHAQRAQSQLLKFIAALLVVVGHQTLFYTKLPKFIVTETSLGDLCVAFFLFMSGYGLLYGQLGKGNAKLSLPWLMKRMVKLVVPALTAMVLYLFVKACLGKDIDWGNVLRWWFLSDMNLPYGWYVTEIIALYIAFFICYRYVNPRYSFQVLNVTIVMAMAVMLAMQEPVWYIKGLPCFMMGLFLARHDAEGRHEGHKTGKLQMRLLMSAVVLVFFALKDFCIVQQMLPFLDRWRYTYLSFYLVGPVFVMIVAYILKRLPICDKMLNRGGYFYEIYLVQGATLLACREFITNDVLFIFAGLVVTVLMAKGMSVLNGWMIKRVLQ